MSTNLRELKMLKFHLEDDIRAYNCDKGDPFLFFMPYYARMYKEFGEIEAQTLRESAIFRIRQDTEDAIGESKKKIDLFKKEKKEAIKNHNQQKRQKLKQSIDAEQTRLKKLEEWQTRCEVKLPEWLDSVKAQILEEYIGFARNRADVYNKHTTTKTRTLETKTINPYLVNFDHSGTYTSSNSGCM